MSSKPVYDIVNDERKAVRALAQGDERAFAEILKHYQNRVFGVAYKILRSRELAKEVVQEVFITVWTKRELFMESEGIEAFCYTAAKNRTLNMLKKLAIEDKARYEFAMDQPGILLEAEYAQDEELLEAHYSELLKKSIAKLTKEQREVYELSNEGLSYNEIAQRMNITSHTVKYHLKNARQFLQAEIKPHLPIAVFLAIFQL